MKTTSLKLKHDTNKKDKQRRHRFNVVLSDA